MGSRSQTKFDRTFIFDEALGAFSKFNAQIILDHIERFQRAWCASNVDGDLNHRFRFEHYKEVRDPYRLCQIRIGPNNNYRAVVMFPDGCFDAHWIYVFKKEGQREPQEMKKAKSIAQEFWKTIKGR